MTIQLDKTLADAICTTVTVGFLQKETRKIGEYKTQFIYEDGKDKADHNKIKGYLKNLGINVDFCLQEDKVTHPLVLAMTKEIPSDTEKIGEIFLHSLTFEGKFTEKMKKHLNYSAYKIINLPYNRILA